MSNFYLKGAQGVQGVTGAVAPSDITKNCYLTGLQGVTGVTALSDVTKNLYLTTLQGLSSGATAPSGVTKNLYLSGLQGLPGATAPSDVTKNFYLSGLQGLPGATAPSDVTKNFCLSGLEGLLGAQGATGRTDDTKALHPTGTQSTTSPNDAVPEPAALLNLQFGERLKRRLIFFCFENGLSLEDAILIAVQSLFREWGPDDPRLN
jgi:hypothetical protein